MSRQNKDNKYYGDKANSYNTDNNSNSMKMSKNDLESLDLLNTQLFANKINIYSDILSYISTLEGIELIYNKYRDEPIRRPNPDVPALQSAYLSLFARVTFAHVAFTKYDYLYEEYINGEIDYSLEPNLNINKASIFGVVSYVYALYGAIGIYERDLGQPIFGI